MTNIEEFLQKIVIDPSSRKEYELMSRRAPLGRDDGAIHLAEDLSRHCMRVSLAEQIFKVHGEHLLKKAKAAGYPDVESYLDRND